MDKQELLNQTLIQIIEVVKSTKGFVIEQAPLVVQEFLRWEILRGLIGGSLLVLLGVVLSGCLVWWIETAVKRTKEVEIRICHLFVLLLFIPIILGIEKLSVGIKAIVAPRVVIIEKFSEIIK